MDRAYLPSITPENESPAKNTTHLPYCLGQHPSGTAAHNLDQGTQLRTEATIVCVDYSEVNINRSDCVNRYLV